MALARIKKGDVVKVITGRNKGKVTTVQAVITTKKSALLSGIGEKKRHQAANRIAPAGKRDIQVPVQLSNLSLVVDEKSSKTSRVGVINKPNGQKVRAAKSMKYKEIK